MFWKRKQHRFQDELKSYKINECYIEQHNFLIYCNDILVKWLHWIYDNNLCKMQINFKNEEEMKSFSKERDNNLMTWLKDNGYEMEMYELNRRHILCSLVADFCHYMLESFVCAAKMKPAVAYALLRKPLRDNLAYIEWLRVEPKELIDKLLYCQPEEYDLSCKKELKKKHIEQIYKKYKIDRNNGMFAFRYEKNEDISLEKIWNKANHIVTTQKYTKSAQGELNFVFVDSEQLEHYTEYYYTVVPQIMAYATELIVGMFEEIADINPFTQTVNKILMTLHQAYGMGLSYYQEGKQMLEVDKCPLICPYCGKKIILNDTNMDKLLFNQYKCKKCHQRLETANYVFDFENLNKYITDEKK